MANTKLLNIQEVSVLVGSSIQTISSWYKWKNLHPDHPLATILPEYTRVGNRRTRYWTQENVWELVKFKQLIPQGRSGVMGDVTQMYVKKRG